MLRSGENLRLTCLRPIPNGTQVAPIAANATSVACVAPRSQYMGGVALSLSLDGGATVLAPEASYVYAHPAVVSSMLPADGPACMPRRLALGLDPSNLQIRIRLPSPAHESAAHLLRSRRDQFGTQTAATA